MDQQMNLTFSELLCTMVSETAHIISKQLKQISINGRKQPQQTQGVPSQSGFLQISCKRAA